MLKWDQALYTEDILSKASKAQAYATFQLNDKTESAYGFGWNIGKTPTGGRMVQHSGSWVGSRTFFRRELDDRRTLILLTNYSAENLTEIRKEIMQSWD